jgi:cytochrome c peroxidase
MPGHSLNWLALNRYFSLHFICCLIFLPACENREKKNPFLGIPSAGNNPITVEGVAFGRALFQSDLLSANRKTSCFTCHRPDSGFSGSMNHLNPHSKIRRQIPSLFNLAWSGSYFWDGREETLESLILKPIQNPDEMNLTLPLLLKKVNQKPELKQMCRAAFQTDSIGTIHLARALAQFIRTLVHQPELPESEGKTLFLNHCAKCHSGKTTSDFRIRRSILAPSGIDSGYFRITHLPQDVYNFRTPGLAEVSKTAPYMHDGRVPDLDSLVRLYAKTLPAQELEDPSKRSALVKFLKML